MPEADILVRRACQKAPRREARTRSLALAIGLLVGRACTVRRLVGPDHYASFAPKLSDLFIDGQPDKLGSGQPRWQDRGDIR